MSKRIVFDSPYQNEVTHVETGIEFVRGEPRTVTDEQAAIILAKHENEFIEGDENLKELAAMTNGNYRPMRNPLFGQQKHPHFRLEEDAETPFERQAADRPAVEQSAPTYAGVRAGFNAPADVVGESSDSK